ncbi:MAG: HypC/HybG/HupF family hydrogenase formation chaperone [Pseudomonadota bacterium]|nr:HypC/HybG/HupF family hydrogenase formation chaperone [Pseudomonadota bacterium]
MCLAIAGRLLSEDGEDALFRTGRVDFGGVVKAVNLACVPEAEVGDLLLVHAGLAIGRIDPDRSQPLDRNVLDAEGV